jgi:hypothetical protein
MNNKDTQQIYETYNKLEEGLPDVIKKAAGDGHLAKIAAPGEKQDKCEAGYEWDDDKEECVEKLKEELGTSDANRPGVGTYANNPSLAAGPRVTASRHRSKKKQRKLIRGANHPTQESIDQAVLDRKGEFPIHSDQ